MPPTSLLAPGASLALPSLGSIPREMVWGETTGRVLGALMREMLRANLYTPQARPVVVDDVERIIATGCARLLGPQPHHGFYHTDVLSLDGIGAGYTFTVMTAHSAKWGAVRETLSRRDPRFANWVFQSLQHAVRPLGPLYDYEMAARHYEMRDEYACGDTDGTPEGEEQSAALCAQLQADQKALDGQHRQLWKTSRVPQGRFGHEVRAFLDATHALKAAGKACRRALGLLPCGEAWKIAACEQFDGGSPAWPALLNETEFDLLEVAFDGDAEAFYEVEHEPNVLIPLDTRTPRTLHDSFAAIRALGDLLRAFSAWAVALDQAERVCAAALDAQKKATAKRAHAQKAA